MATAATAAESAGGAVASPPPTLRSAPAAPPLAGAGYRVGPIPSWVVPVPGDAVAGASAAALPPAQAGQMPGSGARRELLADLQFHVDPGRPQWFQRLRALATDAQALGSVAQAQIAFNPAFQTVTLHHAWVWREGRAQDRLRQARHELMRREQRLEQQVIDGVQTLLVVLPDVRVGEAVEFAYTIEGDNPIYEGRIAGGLQLAWDNPVARMHLRLDVPAERRLALRTMASTLVPEERVEGGRRIIRLLREQVPAVKPEPGTPPWFKVYPALAFSEYRGWADVDAWAQRLFAQAAQPEAAVKAKAEALRASGKTGAALVDEALRFVQDELRYFSVSLGESSHRPKTPARTLADGFGDCKDKAVLLSALLQTLGFDAKPALVSTYRNRGLAQFLPGHDNFDHVVTRLWWEGQPRYLDATLSGQGRRLASRGYVSYGLALVVGEGTALSPAEPPPDALNALDFSQRWDLRQPSQAAALEASVSALGLSAEALRQSLAQGGLPAMAEALGSAHARRMPGLLPVGAPEAEDDREANRVTIRQRFEHPDPGAIERGSLLLDLSAVELLDVLVGPAEPQRRTPFLIHQAARVHSRIEVFPPQPPRFMPAAPVALANRHFRLHMQMAVEPDRIVFDRRWERRADEVLPAELPAYREQLLRARQMTGGRLRLNLAPTDGLDAELARIERRLDRGPGSAPDHLQALLLRHEVGVLLASRALARMAPGSAMAARVLAERALARNAVGDFAHALSDAEAALAVLPAHEPALEARGVALVGLGRLDEALTAFATVGGTAQAADALAWTGAIELLRGQAAPAEAALREAVANSAGESRDNALRWLYLAAERQGRGRPAIAPHLAQADAERTSGKMLQFLDGRIDAPALIAHAQRDAAMQRWDLAEAWFFVAMQQWVRGDTAAARHGWQQVLATGALPYRGHTFARLLLAQTALR